MVEIRSAGAMETVREAPERDESDEDERRSTRIARPTSTRMRRIPGRWFRFGPLMRSWWVRLLCILCAATMVVVVGVLVYRNALSNMRQELKLKCENRVEVCSCFHFVRLLAATLTSCFPFPALLPVGFGVHELWIHFRVER